MKKLSKRALLANTFGTLGYLSCLFSWSWAGILYVPMFLENEQVEKFLLPVVPEEIVSQPPTFEVSPLMIFFTVVVTMIMIVATLFILLKLPSAIAKTGKAVTEKAATSALPLVTKGHQLPPERKKRLTVKLIKLMKLLLVLLPVGAVLLGYLIKLPVPLEIAVLVSSVLALITLFWFSAQYIAARILGVKLEQLV